MKLGGPVKQPFLAALNVSELEMRELYAGVCPRQVWQLNQSPKSGHAMHSTDLWLHTLIRNMGLFPCLQLAVVHATLLFGKPLANGSH